MERPCYAKLYAAPEDYKPPEDHDLRHDSMYPNLNSKDYRKKPINRTPRLLPFFDRIALDDSGSCAILATNDFRNRIWDGYVWGFPGLETVGFQDKACFKIHTNSPVTNIMYIKDNIFAVSQADGTLQVWSTKSDVRCATDYCLFMIGEKSEHLGLILGMDLIETDKIITGCSENCLRMWDTGSGDLYSINAWRSAHADSITGISTNPTKSEPTFATSSRDRSSLLWDYRLPRPAIAIYENHNVDLTTVYWTDSLKHHCENIFLGDESGNILSIDPRMLNKIVNKINVFNKPIRKMEFNGDYISVIGNTNCIKVYKLEGSNYNCIYTNMKTQNFIRDVIWNPNINNELYTIGWDSKIRKHNIN